MELSVLNSQFRRSRLVENWSSLIWTERFASNGDFQLESYDISGVLASLPLGGPFDPPTMVALRDSTVPMVVETHKIEKKKNEAPKIITTGRSAETLLDRRIVIKNLNEAVTPDPWTINAHGPSDAAWFVMDQIIVQGLGGAERKIPELMIVDEVTTPWPEGAVNYPAERKELYTWVVETLKLGGYGLRAILPYLEGTQIAISIYQGQDKRQEVVFTQAHEAFDSTDHLLSVVGQKNVMTITAAHSTGSATLGGTPTGISRREDVVDLSSELTAEAGAPLTELIGNKGKVLLADRLPTAMFSGEIADLQAAHYGIDYSLGDQVKLVSEYGLSQDVTIAEFVRTHDSTGERSYPTFAAINQSSE